MIWDTLLRRHGFWVTPSQEGTVSLARESEENVWFLQRVLSALGREAEFLQPARKLKPCPNDCSERDFRAAWRTVMHSAEGGDSGDLSILEPCMALLIRTLNAFGLRTWGSCEGHHGAGTRAPYIWFDSEADAREALRLIRQAAMTSGFAFDGRANGTYVRWRPPTSSEDLEAMQEQMVTLAELLALHRGFQRIR